MTARNQSAGEHDESHLEGRRREKKRWERRKVGLLVRVSLSPQRFYNMDHEHQEWDWPPTPPILLSGKYISDTLNVIEIIPQFKTSDNVQIKPRGTHLLTLSFSVFFTKIRRFFTYTLHWETCFLYCVLMHACSSLLLTKRTLCSSTLKRIYL